MAFEVRLWVCGKMTAFEVRLRCFKVRLRRFEVRLRF